MLCFVFVGWLEWVGGFVCGLLLVYCDLMRRLMCLMLCVFRLDIMVMMVLYCIVLLVVIMIGWLGWLVCWVEMKLLSLVFVIVFFWVVFELFLYLMFIVWLVLMLMMMGGVCFCGVVLLMVGRLMIDGVMSGVVIMKIMSSISIMLMYGMMLMLVIVCCEWLLCMLDWMGFFVMVCFLLGLML